jgi:hypothetical protein
MYYNGLASNLLVNIVVMFLKLYEGRPERKERLRLALVQVNELHHFKVNGPQ